MICSYGERDVMGGGCGRGGEVLQERRTRNAFHFLIIRTFVRERAHISRSQLISQALTGGNAGQKDRHPLPPHTHTHTDKARKDIAAEINYVSVASS